MRKILAIPVLFLFFFGHSTVFGDFNIFLERKIIVGPFENRGDAKYDYLNVNLREQLYLLLADAPFITLTDRERAFVSDLSEQDEYEGLFSEAGGRISNRVDPHVVKGASSEQDYPLYISGRYTVHRDETVEPETGAVSEPRIHLEIDVLNTMTGTEQETVVLGGALEDFIKNPRDSLFPFLPSFLRYTVYRTTITTNPAEALIFIDGDLVGAGAAEDILVTPGLHRIIVRHGGYKEYRDLIVFEEGSRRHIELQPLTDIVHYHIVSTPAGALVYLDERYQGTTPLSIAVGPDSRTLTLSREGYRSASMAIKSLPQEGGQLHFGLIEADMAAELQRKAERHKQRARILSWTGVGVLGSSVIFGIMTTLRQQEAELTRDTDPDRSGRLQNESDLYNTLLISSLCIAGGIFTFSFVDTVNYFKTYSRMVDYEQIPIVKTEVSF
jgi:hypothetical protein